MGSNANYVPQHSHPYTRESEDIAGWDPHTPQHRKAALMDNHKPMGANR